MSDTPRTDRLIYGMNKEQTVELVNADFARQLERELNELHMENNATHLTLLKMSDKSLESHRRLNEWKKCAEMFETACGDGEFHQCLEKYHQLKASQ